MGAFESLITLLSALSPDVDITFGDDIDIGDIDEDSEVRVKQTSEDTKALVEREIVVLYPAKFRGEEYAKYQKFIRESKREQGEIVNVESKQEDSAIKRVDADGVDSAISFYEGLISDRHITILRNAFYIRKMKESDDIPPGFDLDQKKRDVAEMYGYESYYIIHLASSGYFDEGRYFRQLYEDLENEDENTEQQYKKHFDNIIGEKLIAVFVNSEDSVYDVESEIKATMAKYFRYLPPCSFLDVCGVGQNCRETITKSIDNLNDEFENIQTEPIDREGEHVIRIYPETVRGSRMF